MPEKVHTLYSFTLKFAGRDLLRYSTGMVEAYLLINFIGFGNGAPRIWSNFRFSILKVNYQNSHLHIFINCQRQLVVIQSYEMLSSIFFYLNHTLEPYISGQL